MGDFETNPDINDNQPIPLREALEKMKPFLMAYEGIESQEEWEVSAVGITSLFASTFLNPPLYYLRFLLVAPKGLETLAIAQL